MRQAADLEVFHQDVALQCQLFDQSLTFGLGNVNRDRTFIAVAGGEIAGVRGVLTLRILHKGRAPMARVVTLAGLFDFDDIGTHVGQHLRTPGAGEHPREVEDFEVGEGGGGLGHGGGFRSAFGIALA